LCHGPPLADVKNFLNGLKTGRQIFVAVNMAPVSKFLNTPLIHPYACLTKPNFAEVLSGALKKLDPDAVRAC
jgi:hypothetical protein